MQQKISYCIAIWNFFPILHKLCNTSPARKNIIKVADWQFGSLMKGRENSLWIISPTCYNRWAQSAPNKYLMLFSMFDIKFIDFAGLRKQVTLVKIVVHVQGWSICFWLWQSSKYISSQVTSLPTLALCLYTTYLSFSATLFAHSAIVWKPTKNTQHNFIYVHFPPTKTRHEFQISITFYALFQFFQPGKMEVRTQIQRFASSRSTTYRNTPTRK